MGYRDLFLARLFVKLDWDKLIDQENSGDRAAASVVQEWAGWLYQRYVTCPVLFPTF